VRTHEKALANSLQTNARPRPVSLSASGPSSQYLAVSSAAAPPPSASGGPSAISSSLSYLGIASQNAKPAKLYLTPNQLYYLLSRFEELGVNAGPMNVRLENIHADHASSNYVSFLTQATRPTGRRGSDQDSIHSVSSVRSVVSGISSMWSGFSLSHSTAKEEKRKAAELEDLRYLYSAFTKIPCLKLALDHRIRRIAGYEEFPFDSAVPVYVFKNLSTLEIADTDFRQVFGWDRLAEQLRSLTLKRAGIDDLSDLLVHIVLDDIERRRRRSAKQGASPTISQPMQHSFSNRSTDQLNSPILPDSPTIGERRASDDNRTLGSEFSQSLNARPSLHSRMTTSASPPRPQSSRRSTNYTPGRPGKSRQSSGTCTPSVGGASNRNSMSNFALLEHQQANRWRLLRHLSLSDNGLMTISRTSLNPITSTLQSLDLSSNLFTEIPESLAALVHLRALNLSNCMIESLQSLARSPLPAISVLNLRGNRISSLSGIEKLLSLERLDLRENKLRDPTELARLTGMPDFHDVYVSKNTFVKTHPNHRITIFNLFRQSPGYTDDVMVDATPPSYSEKRQLVDRVPEPTNVPVIRPPAEDEAPEHSNYSISATSAAESAPSVYDMQSQRRRKAPRRRIVDIARIENTKQSSMEETVDSSFLTSVQSAPLARRPPSLGEFAKDPRLELHAPGLSPIPQSPDPHSASTLVEDISADERADLSLSSDQYRQKIEALRNDLGSNWLSALGDDGWQRERDSPSPLPQSPMISPPLMSPPLTASANTPVMASSRRLG